jgi:hypothetical protein
MMWTSGTVRTKIYREKHLSYVFIVLYWWKLIILMQSATYGTRFTFHHSIIPCTFSCSKSKTRSINYRQTVNTSPYCAPLRDDMPLR